MNYPLVAYSLNHIFSKAECIIINKCSFSPVLLYGCVRQLLLHISNHFVKITQQTALACIRFYMRSLKIFFISRFSLFAHCYSFLCTFNSFQNWNRKGNENGRTSCNKTAWSSKWRKSLFHTYTHQIEPSTSTNCSLCFWIGVNKAQRTTMKIDKHIQTTAKHH